MTKGKTPPPNPHRSARNNGAMPQLEKQLNELTLGIYQMRAILHGLRLATEQEDKPAKVSDTLESLIAVAGNHAAKLDNDLEEIKVVFDAVCCGNGA